MSAYGLEGLSSIVHRHDNHIAVSMTFEHLLVHGIQLALKSMGHIRTCTVMQQDNAVREFT
jgi:hypothetical protein